MFRVTSETLSVEAVEALVRRVDHGAVVTFAGIVRGRTGDRQTSHLVYEAYAEMAERQMAEIAGQAIADWGVGAVSIVHRVGRLEVGETAVIVCVGSGHRGEAFAACRQIIDRVKEVVPIWKKEVGEDGEEWVGGP